MTGIPIGRLPPFFKDADPLPAGLDALQFPVLQPPGYPRRAWDPDMYARAVLAEFTDQNWRATVVFDDWPRDQAVVSREIQLLIFYAERHFDRIPEIVMQQQDPLIYWQNLMLMTAMSHPATWDLLYIGLAVGQLVAMDAKLRFNRPRPVQIYPALMPPILTPPHPSYPNAHMLQSRLMSRAAAEANPAMEAPLLALASRVGFNREIACVHYPSDTAAGLKAADLAFDVLKRSPLFMAVLNEAKLEWPAPPPAPPAAPAPVAPQPPPAAPAAPAPPAAPVQPAPPGQPQQPVPPGSPPDP